MIPSLAVVAVIAIVLLAVIVLNWGVFGPVTRIMRQREAAIQSARELAEAAAARAAQAASDLDRQTRAAQAAIHREMEETRRAALDERAVLVAEARRDVEARVAEAAARLEAQAGEARRRLEKEAESLGAAVAERLLGRKAS